MAQKKRIKGSYQKYYDTNPSHIVYSIFFYVHAPIGMIYGQFLITNYFKAD